MEDNVEYFELIPISQEKAASLKNFGIRFRTSELNLMNIESLLRENRQLQIQLEKAKEALKIFNSEGGKVQLNNSGIKDIDQQKVLKRAKKLKQLDEDNKKLRQLLRNQLENSEKLRVETQATIETLKEEFELLVKELTSMQKKNVDSLQSSVLGNKGGYLLNEQKSNEIRPKIDKIEMLLSDQQHSSMQADEELSRH